MEVRGTRMLPEDWNIDIADMLGLTTFNISLREVVIGSSGLGVVMHGIECFGQLIE